MAIVPVSKRRIPEVYSTNRFAGWQSMVLFYCFPLLNPFRGLIKERLLLKFNHCTLSIL